MCPVFDRNGSFGETKPCCLQQKKEETETKKQTSWTALLWTYYPHSSSYVTPIVSEKRLKKSERQKCLLTL